MNFFEKASIMYLSKLSKGICENERLGPKKQGKVKKKWNTTCVNFDLPLKKLNTPMKTMQFLFLLKKYFFI